MSITSHQKTSYRIRIGRWNGRAMNRREPSVPSGWFPEKVHADGLGESRRQADGTPRQNKQFWPTVERRGRNPPPSPLKGAAYFFNASRGQDTGRELLGSARFAQQRVKGGAPLLALEPQRQSQLFISEKLGVAFPPLDQ